jgi:hypothetical protein
MRVIKEIRENDLSIRAGVIISDGQYLLVEQPAKGVIRETYEETNIKFESWKLTRPIQTICDGDPLFLFYAKIDQLIPTSLLSCASTFVDEDAIRKSEVEAYYWLNSYTQIYLMQDRLILGIRYYFKSEKRFESTDELSETKEEFEDCQTAGGTLGSVPPNIKRISEVIHKV